MHYVMGDIHNDNSKFERMLKRINLQEKDHLFVLGDLFDRCNSDPDPIGIYFNILKLADQVTVVVGNHDIWLADYIENYYSVPERKRNKLTPYGYNSFEILKSRLVEVDMLRLASFIRSFTFQVELDISGEKYLLAHAMTSKPPADKPLSYYIMGVDDSDYYQDGIPGYISICGHTDSSFMKSHKGSFSADKRPSIWRNIKGNLFMIDCGCGFSSGRLACVCLENNEEYYE